MIWDGWSKKGLERAKLINEIKCFRHPSFVFKWLYVFVKQLVQNLSVSFALFNIVNRKTREVNVMRVQRCKRESNKWSNMQ